MSLFLAQQDELHIGGKSKLLFAHPIVQVEDFGEVAVVRLGVPAGTRYNENVFGVSASGHLLWQVKPGRVANEESPYTNISRDGALVKCFNWKGYFVWLSPETGEEIKRAQTK